jgi:hypothetical protein
MLATDKIKNVLAAPPLAALGWYVAGGGGRL